MAAITDGTFTSPLQDGDKQVVFPFDFLGDAYARIISRPYVMLSSSYSAPRTLTTTSVTNMFLRSEAFENAAWTATALTVTADNHANPANGATTADRLMETAVSSGHALNATAPITVAASAITVSVFAKANGRDWFEIAVTDSAATLKRSFFDLTNGVVGTTSSNTTSAIVSVGNGWYRVSQTWTSPASGAANFYFELSTDGSTVSYLGDITKGVYLWGAQLEQSASLGTYLPTTSATRTSALRTRDSVDNSGDSAADYFSFLCQETPPDAGSLRQGIVRLSREYCRLPATQTDYGNAIINRPNLHGYNSGGYYGVTFDNGATSHVFATGDRIAVTSASAPVVGGTYAGVATAVNKTGHGRSAGESLAVWSDDRCLGVTEIILVFDANSFYISNENLGAGAMPNYYALQSSADARYVNGPISVSTKSVTDFYYPGWSSGVTTPADITVSSSQLDPVSWFGLIVAATSFGVIEGSKLDRWRESPFYAQTTISAQMSDALETVAVGA